MTSTRNKNTIGNYELEKWSKERQFQTKVYTHASQGKAVTVHYAGNGLIGGKMHSKDLAHNACDIESFLFGIGSTNLEQPKSPVHPELKTLDSLNIIHKKPVFLPEALIVEPEQRPFFLN